MRRGWLPYLGLLGLVMALVLSSLPGMQPGAATATPDDDQGTTVRAHATSLRGQGADLQRASAARATDDSHAGRGPSPDLYLAAQTAAASRDPRTPATAAPHARPAAPSAARATPPSARGPPASLAPSGPS